MASQGTAAGNRWLIGALMLGPLLALTGYIVYDQREKALRREYFDAVSAYRAYLAAERLKDENEDSAFAIEASKAERAARETGGTYGEGRKRIQNFYENERRKLKREEQRIQKETTGPPPREWVRFQEAAKKAGMPSTLQDAR
jgi:hypothetical protein